LLAALALCALVPAAPAIAGDRTLPTRPPVTFVRGDGSYTKASRGLHAVHFVVIHTTDGGSFAGNVWWLSGAHSHASAHYVVSRDGHIDQLVHLSDIAWHAGNWKVNAHSIGIEHVGDTYDPAGFPLGQYRASARLVGWLVRRYGIPVDREHIIGHYQVPDPNDPTQFGGSDHHTDPGPYWNWKLYMRLVRHYAFPLPPLLVRSTTIYRGQTLAGIVPWRVTTKGRAQRVDFSVDGRLLWSDHVAPFSFAGGGGWNTTAVDNGRHVLEVCAVRGGRKAVARYVVDVRNHDFALTTSALHSWQKVRGIVRLQANVRGAKTTGIVLYVDGRAISRDRTAPFSLRWNTHRVRDGKHVVVLSADAIDGRRAKRRVILVVKNTPPRPKPKPKPAPKPIPAPPAVTSQTLADGQTVQGTVDWQASTTGPVVRVEFRVDGIVRGTTSSSPWSYSWDTTAEAPGTHVVAVRAVASDGRTAELSATVTVAAPAPAP
jgi:N-acetylmuramoyl-L-alanine amidase/Bacterial Ig domain